MKKKHTVLIILFVFVVVVSAAIAANIVYVNRKRIDNYLFFLVDKSFDDSRASEVGDEFEKYSWGDFTYINNNYFCINHYKGGNKLDFVQDGEKITVLNSVISYDIADYKFYVFSKTGFAVIDINQVAKIYTSEKRVSLENIHYVDSPADFEKKDLEVFDSMKF